MLSPMNNEYSNQFVSQNQSANLLAPQNNLLSQSFVSNPDGVNATDSSAMLSKEFIKTRKLMMMKNK